ncbi:hypothetical protein Godav_004146 [Gossypium davidsonii]|uniref:Uncharacterized protein n=2 Tax=Gossypium TaxID=3633 RepID=A0A7J8SLR9_GOSDV|nr:hypothetical protein [Gossypium davidsonii]MBA0662103.1 hypothetical protein [Gossypium klotzschianum]
MYRSVFVNGIYCNQYSHCVELFKVNSRFAGFGLHAFNIIAQQTPSGICPVSIDNRKCWVTIANVTVDACGVFRLLTILAALFLSVRIVLFECHVPNIAYKEVSQKFLDAGKAMWMTLKWLDDSNGCLFL